MSYWHALTQVKVLKSYVVVSVNLNPLFLAPHLYNFVNSLS